VTITLAEYLARLETADATITKENAALLLQTVDDLVVYAQSIEHRVSGNMAESTHRLGPFASGGGVLEARIESGAWYAPEEVAKGGTHDWPTRTIEEQAARIQQFARDVEGAVVRVLTGSA
jgi:hypothetical protein